MLVEICGYIGMAILFVIFVAISILVIKKKPNIKGELMLLIGIWGTTISAFLLPNMHERYLIIADVLSIIYIIIYNKNIIMAIIINVLSLYLYWIYLMARYLIPVPPIFMAILYLALVVYLTTEVIERIINKKTTIEIVGKEN